MRYISLSLANYSYSVNESPFTETHPYWVSTQTGWGPSIYSYLLPVRYTVSPKYSSSMISEFNPGRERTFNRSYETVALFPTDSGLYFSPNWEKRRILLMMTATTVKQKLKNFLLFVILYFFI